MKKAIVLGILAMFTALSMKAQDPHFSQFYANPLYLNPAFTGSSKCPRVNTSYRNQFPSIAADFVTYSVSYDQHIDALHGGLGLMVISDRAGQGALGITEVSGIYSYQLVVNQNFSILAGFQGTFRQRSLDWSKLNFPDQIDEKYGFVRPTQEEAPSEPTISHLDLSAGVIGFSDFFYFGGAVHHLTEPNEAFLEQGFLPMRFTAHSGAIIPLSGSGRVGDSKFLSPNILYYKQQDFEQLNLGISAQRNELGAGFWFRQNFNNADAIMVIIGYQPDNFRIGYSYDFTVSKIGPTSGGAHEVSFSYQFECSPKKRKFKTINCPSF